jgi:hypothetical protein
LAKPHLRGASEYDGNQLGSVQHIAGALQAVQLFNMPKKMTMPLPTISYGNTAEGELMKKHQRRTSWTLVSGEARKITSHD